MYGINPTSHKNYTERAHYSRNENVVGDAPIEITKFRKHGILSSSAWSSVIHQPSQDPEPEDLPSTVDINAIKESSKSLLPLSTPDQFHSEGSSVLFDESDSDTDSESDNTDNGAENGKNTENSPSFSDSDSISSVISSSNSRNRQNSSNSSRSNSPILENDQNEFSEQENSLEQNGMKSKLSALKISKFEPEVQEEDAEISSDSIVSKLSVKQKKPSQNMLPKSCELFDDSEDIKSSSFMLKEMCHSNTKLNLKNEVKTDIKEIPAKEISLQEKNTESFVQKTEISSFSDSGSDAEIISKQITTDAIKSVTVDSDSSYNSGDDIHRNMKSCGSDSLSETNEMYEGEIKKVCEKLNLDLESIIDSGVENKHYEVMKNRKCKLIPSREAEHYLRMDNSISNVSPDSGIRSNSGSPLYHNAHSSSIFHTNLYFKTNGETFSSSSVPRSLYSNRKTILPFSKKNSFDKSKVDSWEIKKLHSNNDIASPLVDFELNKNIENVDDVLDVPPYVAGKMKTLGGVALGTDSRRLENFHRAKICKEKGSLFEFPSSMLPRTSRKLKQCDHVTLCVKNKKKCKKKKCVTDEDCVRNFVPVFGDSLDWQRKHSKKVTKTKSIDVEALKDIENLTILFQKMCIFDNTKSKNELRRSKIVKRSKERSKICNFNDKDSESETNSTLLEGTINDVKTKRKNKKNVADISKIQEVNHRLPLKKRHYHISTSSTITQALSEINVAVNEYSSTKKDDSKIELWKKTNSLPCTTKIIDDMFKTKVKTSKVFSCKRDAPKFIKQDTSNSTMFQIEIKEELAKYFAEENSESKSMERSVKRTSKYEEKKKVDLAKKCIRSAPTGISETSNKIEPKHVKTKMKMAFVTNLNTRTRGTRTTNDAIIDVNRTHLLTNTPLSCLVKMECGDNIDTRCIESMISPPILSSMEVEKPRTRLTDADVPPTLVPSNSLKKGNEMQFFSNPTIALGENTSEEKFERLEPPLLIEETKVIDSLPLQRIWRPKRSCTENKNSSIKKTGPCDVFQYSMKVANNVGVIEDTSNKKSKYKNKRRKRNLTGFPSLRKKKKFKTCIEGTSIACGKDNSKLNLSSNSKTGIKNERTMHLFIGKVKMEATEIDHPAEVMQTSTIPVKEIEKKKSYLSSKNYLGPSRCSARISIKKEIRARELKRLQRKTKIKRVAAKKIRKCGKKKQTRVEDKNQRIYYANKIHNLRKRTVEKTNDVKKSQGVNRETKIKIQDVNDDTKSDAPPKRRRNYVIAGLFSNFYKGEISTGSELKAPYKENDHPDGLLPPPPYFEDWVRRRRVNFKLPYDLWWLHTRNKLPGRDIVESWKYKRIRTNVYYDVKPPNVYEAQACNCKLPNDKIKLGCGEDCINRVVYAECSPDLCPLQEKCSNQRIQKHNGNMKLTRFMTKDKGIGVRTEKPIRSGEYILEYVGEVVTDKEFKNRMTTLYKNDIHHYCLSLDGGLVIDAHRMGGDGRFVNHSCEPNCEIQKWTVNGLFRMALFAQRDIESGEELSYDYNFALFNPEVGQPCRCGSSECRGVIGGKWQRVCVPTVNDRSNPESNITRNVSYGASSTTCRKSRLKPRKRVRKGAVKQRKRELETSNPGENVLPRRNRLSLAPFEPLTDTEKDFVRESRVFLDRNLSKVRKVWQKRKLNEQNENSNLNLSTKGCKTKQLVEFSMLLNVLSRQRFIKTRGLSQVEENPEITKILKLANIFRTIYNFVVSAKDEKDGKAFSSFFTTLPNKEKYPAYYRLIEDPIALNSIEKNIVNGVYKDAESFDMDMKRLISNNIKFYGRISEQGIAAARLKKEFSVAKLNYIPQIEEVIGQPVPASFKPVSDDVDEGVIRCICGRFVEEGEMILCDRCLVWQHCTCIQVDPDVERYHCERCTPREVDYEIPLNIEKPEFPMTDETRHYYLTLMRDDLQIRLDDTVYVLRDITNPETNSIHTFRTIGKFNYEDCDIFRVTQLYKTENGDRFAFGHHYLRPYETHHEPTRRFFPNEVLKFLVHEEIPLDLIMGRCYVLDLSTYCKGRPMDSDPDHIYICEYRVDKLAKNFFKLPKLKAGYSVPMTNYAFEKYETRLKPSRTYAPHGDVTPQFKSRPKKTKDGGDYHSRHSSKHAIFDNSKICKARIPVTKFRNAMVEKRKQMLNIILLKLLAKQSTKAPLDASYLLDIGRRKRKKPDLTNST